MKGFLVLMIDGIEQELIVVNDIENQKERNIKVEILRDKAKETSFDADEMWINYFYADNIDNCVNKYSIY